ncbi:unnamed protein product, partial [Didymodactylos carnosus]
LGDDENGHDYVTQIGSLRKDPMILDSQQRIPKTISGYLDLYTSVGLPTNVDPRTFLFNVSKFNNMLPRNVYLLCGDPSLELLSKALEIKRSSNIITPYTNPWRSITQSLRTFILKIGERRGIKLMAFIDTNSSFSICTEIALTAADRILLPVSEDHLHRNGFEYLFSLLYGFSQPSNVYYYYRHYSFYYRADENGVKLPKIHLILCTVKEQKQHQQTTNNTSDIEKCWRFVFDIYTKHRDAFESYRSSIPALLNNNYNVTTTTSPSSSSSSSSTASNTQHHPHSDSISISNNTHNYSSLSSNQNGAQTFQEFMKQYVIHIGTDTNIVSRIAVKAHSPLLAVKNPHPEHATCAQSFDKILNEIVERI